MNSVALVGRLTQDPEARTSKSGETAYTSFGLAVNDRYKGEDRATFVNVVAFGKLSEILVAHKHKGDQISVTGRLTTSEGFKDLKVVADRVEFLARANGNGKDHAAQGAQAQADEEVEAIPF